ncbi:MAG TPA: indole-3-glycerol phosphate synthase TrpC [Candidatus Eisenbacteria bacterium]|nr:indole-3-glycerol phosphate synthase TrpC [Candidatus Eisenbacteria bacterium]
MSGDFLAVIGRERLERVREDARRIPLNALREEAESRRGDRRPFLDALRRPAGAPLRAIAEVKQASPSAGIIRTDYDPAGIAERYAEAGATAISVLTEPNRFRGSIEDLARVRDRVALPVLLKDFVVDERQLYEARARGADAALLIVGLLDVRQLADYAALCMGLGLDPLVEIHEASELDRALSVPGAIGVNNRDLRTLAVRRGHAEALLERIPSDRVRVAESGYRTREEIVRLEELGADAVLIGETLLRQGDVRAGFTALFGAPEGGR